MNVSDPGRFADLAATNMNFRIADKDEVLQRLDVGQRLRFILTRLEREVARARVMEDVKRQTEIKIEQHQREFYLRQQLRAIQASWARPIPARRKRVELLKRIEEAKLPEQGAAGGAARDGAAAHAVAGVERVPGDAHLPRLDPRAALEQAIRDDDEIELDKVEEALDARHYGLDEAKERILEYLAVRKLRGGDPHGPDPLLRRSAGHRQDLARRSDRHGDRAARSTASRWAACATRPRFAATGARTWARCPDC